MAKSLPHDHVVPYTQSGESKKSQVAEMFDKIALRYDFMNRFLSGGIDVYWRKRAIAELRELRPRMVLDVATGTADVALLLHKYLSPEKIIGIDISEKNRFNVLCHFPRLTTARISEIIPDGLVHKQQLRKYHPCRKAVIEPEGMYAAYAYAGGVFRAAHQHAVVLQEPRMLAHLETRSGAHDYNTDVISLIIVVGKIEFSSELSF